MASKNPFCKQQLPLVDEGLTRVEHFLHRIDQLVLAVRRLRDDEAVAARARKALAVAMAVLDQRFVPPDRPATE